MAGSHVAVALRDGRTHGQIAVLSVHVVGAGPGVVPQPDAEILDLEWLPLAHFLHADNFAGGLLELAKLTQEVPKPSTQKIRDDRDCRNSHD